ncbi:MAG: radical SAM/SPASM domain-containing protein [Planctomycetota bacterium]
MPRKVRLEASSACQLRCPLCPTGTGDLSPVVGTGRLELRNFATFLDAHPEVREIELSNWGEMFLNPELSGIMKLALERDVALTAKNGVNLNTASEEVLCDLVRYRFRNLVLSIDGASQETYAIYRVRGDLERVLENVRTINRFKAEQRSIYPLLTWKFIIFAHNEHEIRQAREMALGLGMVFYPDLNWNEDWSPPQDSSQVREDTGLPVASMTEHKKKYRSAYSKNFCFQLWNEPQINWDGKILGCCINTWSDFGENVFNGGSLDTEKLGYAKRMLLGEAEPRADIPCTGCPQYLGMREHDDWLRERDVRRDARRKRWKAAVHRLLSWPVFRPFACRLLSHAASSRRWRD